MAARGGGEAGAHTSPTPGQNGSQKLQLCRVTVNTRSLQAGDRAAPRAQEGGGCGSEQEILGRGPRGS